MWADPVPAFFLRKTFFTLACAAWAAGIAVQAKGEDAAAGAHISFNRDIRPILSSHCFQCHGPDGVKRQAGLRLDVRDIAVHKLDSGSTAIVPGHPDASELIARLLASDEETVMPPPEAKLERLGPQQIDLLKRWINQGAEYEPHWTFVPVKEPVIPGQVVKHQNPIDSFVSAYLATRGIALQAAAARETLIRRVSFDITGLPPTIAEIEAFLADTAPQAYETLLDRLLASPRYGERMAADWMDLARYSDSYGFQVDRERPTWPWRDWVVGAFNRNMPWNDFATWQLAGDLLPNATDEQILATAFNRLHQQECEGGSVEEEYRVNSINDRVTTFGTAFLGLTLECCRCHDHKFDPLSQKEFYQFFAFFDDIDEAGLYAYFTPATPTPKLRLTDASTAVALEQDEQATARAAAQVSRCEEDTKKQIADWLAGKQEIPPALAADRAGSIVGEIVHYSFDARAADGTFPSVLDANHAATSPADNVLVDGHGNSQAGGKAIRLTGDHPLQTPVGNFRRSHPFTIALWLKTPDSKERAVIFHRSQAWTDAASRGYELLLVEGHLRWSLIHFWPGDAVSIESEQPVPIDEWVHVTVVSDGSGKASGLQLLVNGHAPETKVVQNNLTREITGGGGDTICIGERMRDRGFQAGVVDDFRVFDRQLSALEILELVTPGTLARIVSEGADRKNENAELLADYLALAFDSAAITARTNLEASRRTRDDRAEHVPEIMVMRESLQPKIAAILERGEYHLPGQRVQPDTPAVLPPFPVDQPRNRLGLARWLTAPHHPLLARVTVNRLWQSLFGVGLVRSSEDLGSQSVPAEHPELLDWLAWEFSRSGWDMKHLLKTILLSKTYCQQSIAGGRIMADDPLNLWLARGPRHRLSAEMIRDGALAACGLLVEKIGGPAVNTYDIPESFKPSPAGTGESLYRRSLYTFWRRTGPAPVMESFDVPKRVVCVARRDVTNTPLHACVLLNGPQFVEAARVLAERLLTDQVKQQVVPIEPMPERAFYLLTSRRPDEHEREILRRMHAEQLAWYQAHPEESTKLLAIGATQANPVLQSVEVAALASVVSALLNYDGCVVKR